VVAALWTCELAAAAAIDTGNPDVALTWGNTIRYNAGWRVHAVDSAIANTRNTDEGTLSYPSRGDMVMNRFDLLSEVDVDYRRLVGARISAAAWRDFAFHDEVRFNAGIPNNIPSYNNGRFSDRTKRFHKEGGEILDAYVYLNVDAAGRPGTLKAGRHTVLWGEAAILQPFGISDGQSPVDAIKAITTPGVDAKEIALPTGQVSLQWQVLPTLSLVGQYFFEWKSTRAPQGGTYLGSTDFIIDGPDRLPLPNGAAFINRGLIEPKQYGDWGAGLRWSPAWLEGGTLGFYYRDFTEKSPTASVNPARGEYAFFFPRHQKAYGVSFTQQFFGVSFGADIVRRQNAVLNSMIQNGSLDAARGNAWTGLINGIKIFGPNNVWSSATALVEIGYSRLDKVTANEQFFPACEKRPAGDQGANTGCSTRDNWVAAVRFAPNWTAVFPGWDASASLGLSYGLKGNSPLILPDHGQERAGSYSVGTTWTYNSRHDFTLAYVGYLATRETLNGAIRVSNGSQRQDRGWLSFSYKGSF